MDCHVTTRDGRTTTVGITLNFDSDRISPAASVMSSDESLIVSQPQTPAVARPGTLWRYTAIQTAEGKWQLLGYTLTSSSSEWTSVEFYEQTGLEPAYGAVLNTLSAVGICAIRYEDSQ
jgi:hypothetical protein